MAVWFAIRGTERAPSPIIVNSESQLPRIDVFITYCGEGIDILKDTARATAAQNYPQSKFRIIVLDDSVCDQLKQAVLELRGSNHPDIHYATRNVKVDSHAKASNLNFGLRFTDSLPAGSAEFAAILDVDMIPEPNWLRTVVSYVLSNPRIGLACPWQYFYNTPAGDPLGWGADLATWVLLVQLQNLKGQAPCTGTGFVVRRSALDEIGGFSEDSVSEDILTSALLCCTGWQTVYVPGALQWGLAADSMADFLRQRPRWTAGFLSISVYLGFPPRKLPSSVRFSPGYWGMGIIEASAALTWTIAMLSFPLLLMTGKPFLPSVSSNSSVLSSSRFLSRLAIFDFMAQSLFQALVSSLLDYHVSFFNGPIAGVWNAPYRLALIAHIYFPKVLGAQTPPRFTPTGINTALGVVERDQRKKGLSCLHTVLWGCRSWMNLLILSACVAGACVAIYNSFEIAIASGPGAAALFMMQTWVGWPPLFFIWAVLLRNALTPLIYGIWPPAVVGREVLLDRDPKTGVAHPQQHVKDCQLAPASQSFWLSTSAAILMVAIFCESQP